MVEPLPKTARLQQEIAILDREATQLSTTAAGVTGWDNLRLKHQVQELQLTIASKRWELAALELAEEGALAAFGTSSYYLDQENPEYLVKVYSQLGQVVATETIAWNSHADGYCSLYIWGPLTGANKEWDNLKRALQPISREVWAELLNTMLRAEVIQWRYADLRSGMWVYQSVFETLTHFAYTVKASGWHDRDDRVVLKKRRYRVAPFQQCRVCGCTNDNCAQCVAATGQPCHWVAPYLCSRCAAEQGKGDANRG